MFDELLEASQKKMGNGYTRPLVMVELSREEKEAFATYCRKNNTTAAGLLRAFIRKVINQ